MPDTSSISIRPSHAFSNAQTPKHPGHRSTAPGEFLGEKRPVVSKPTGQSWGSAGEEQTALDSGYKGRSNIHTARRVAASG